MTSGGNEIRVERKVGRKQERARRNVKKMVGLEKDREL